MKKIFNIAFAAALGATMLAASCTPQEPLTYEGRNALFFAQQDSDGNWQPIGETTVSSVFYPDVDEYTQNFQVNLIGNKFDRPTPYTLVVVDSLSDMDALEYVELPDPPTFGADVITDMLPIKVKTSLIPRGYSGKVAVVLVGDDIFREGYADMRGIVLVVNNVATKPSWWDKVIELSYLGEFSEAKVTAFIECTGLRSLEGMEPFELRKICREFKKYVEENDLTEADGSPMVVPIY